jgi:hypothetical protein
MDVPTDDAPLPTPIVLAGVDVPFWDLVGIFLKAICALVVAAALASIALIPIAFLIGAAIEGMR